jgi:hypothetical protein
MSIDRRRFIHASLPMERQENLRNGIDATKETEVLEAWRVSQA